MLQLCNMCGCIENLEETLTTFYHGAKDSSGHAKIHILPYRQSSIIS